jgi:hypothetical protein
VDDDGEADCFKCGKCRECEYELVCALHAVPLVINASAGARTPPMQATLLAPWPTATRRDSRLENG